MSLVAGDVINYDMKSGKRDRLLLQARATTTGATGVLVQPLTWQDDPGITIVRGGTAGLYLVTFPKAADAIGSADVQVVSPTGAVKGGYWTAFDPIAGTGSVQLVDATGVAADPANGNWFVLSLILSMRKDF